MAEPLAVEDQAAVLASGRLELTARLYTASNSTFTAVASLDGVELACVYKPVRGERPLWDYPDGTLAGREVAAYLVSRELAGDGAPGVVPTTVLGDGPHGVGMVQAWVEVAGDDPVAIVERSAVPDGWRHVVDARDYESDEPVSLVHEDSPALRRVAFLDAVIENGDRKGGHLLPDGTGAIWGCDHGVSMSVEPKLRTVLWGWATEPLHDHELALLDRLAAELDGPRLRGVLAQHVTPVEVLALVGRVDALRAERVMPLPAGHGPAIPWPAF